MNLNTQLPQPALFDDVPDLDDSDRICMAEIASVLSRHGKLERFDLALAHRHFDIDEAEVLIETNDPDARTLLVRPFDGSQLPDGAVLRETQWHLMFDGIKASSRCRQACWTDLKDRHYQKHHYVSP